MLMDLCQRRCDGAIHYYIGLIKYSRGSLFIVEVPTKTDKVQPEIELYLPLDFEMNYVMLGYKAKL